MNSSTLSPFAKGKRFSTSTSSQDKQPLPQLQDVEVSASPKRSSKLNDFMSRTRTASLPPRPHTSGGPTSSKPKLSARLGGFKGKGKEKAELLSPDVDDDGRGEYTLGAAASSMTSVVDPFAAHPTVTEASSFVTYSPVVGSPSSFSSSHPPLSRRNSKRPQTMQSISAASTAPSIMDIVTPPTSPTTSVAPSQPASPPTRRRGSLLVAASDALSTFARKTPNMKPRMGRQQSTKANAAALGIHTPQPIVLTEVIEISENAVRASKQEAEEEEERQRLRDAAAKALGIRDMDIETTSMSSRMRSELLDTGEEEYGGTGGGRDSPDWYDAKTPVAARSDMGHSRSRSGSYIPPHAIPFSTHSTRPSTPSIASTQLTVPSSSLGTSAPRSPLLPPSSPPPRNPSTKSLSTPPALSLNTRTTGPPSRKISAARLREHAKPVQERALPPPKIPPFPSTHASLKPFIQRSGPVPRYYPAPSLLMFALSKQWKNRYLVLTSPLPSPMSPNTPTFSSPWGGHARTEPASSFLHLFKGAGPDEKEIERLEINEESVVYVADGEVGGRTHVIKVGGVPKKKPQNLATSWGAVLTPPDGAARTSSSSIGSGDAHAADAAGAHAPHDAGLDGKTMWAVQVVDAEQAQAWIAAIKGAVLSQRSIRAGLGSAQTGAIEPRGDLDVVLSMRALHSPISQRANPFDSLPGSMGRPEGSISPTQSQFTDVSRSSPTSSLSRSQSLVHPGTSGSPIPDSAAAGDAVVTSLSPPPVRPQISTTTAIKSLFTIGGGRPRSPSSASVTGTPNTASNEDTVEEYPEDSFGHAGTSLLGMIRDRPMSPVVQSATPRATTPSIPTEAHPIFLERKILPDSDRHQLEQNITPTPARDIPGRRDGGALPRESMLSIPHRVSTDGGHYSPSLQPPPRKRAGTVSTVALSVSSPSESESYHYTHTNRSTAESLGVQNPQLLTPSPPMPSPLPPAASRPKDRRARASWSSVSTYGSNDHAPSSPDESRSRRWSRRGSLPQRMSPPYPAYSSPSESPRLQNTRMPAARHPYAAETSPLSRSPSMKSDHIPDIQPRLFSAKRASTSSVQSYSSTTSPVPTLGSAVTPKFGQRPRSSHRASMPPPQRPAPNVALPPTPGDSSGTSPTPTSPASDVSASPPTKLSFRETLLLRGRRQSSTPALPPPSVGLPPRPDEAALRAAHARTPSHGSAHDIPTGSLLISPTGTLGQPAFPPPSGPLPPTPQLPSAPASPGPSSRHSSLTRRFRRMSSPVAPVSPDAAQTAFLPPAPLPPSPILETAVHPVPLGAPITTAQNDPDFLALAPATPTGSGSDRSLSADGRPPLDAPEVGPIALSPPPRRGSRQLALPVLEPESSHEGEATLESVRTVARNAQVGRDVDDRLRLPPEVDDFAPSSSASS
ncbi:hypothetical protein PsYK624_044260 [Phanerochaete sordida]|uniref:Uncharacterized protein n=1 Tax=Phanerochaete sordida TaxID=48140 RepID=A0A9P3G4W1_9APHY|nr:hypothetical protein PsYK624_044260 [Phanerochaete sordida]